MVTIVKKIIFRLYVIGLMCFTVWYGYFMYPLIFGFEGKEEAAASLTEIDVDVSKEEEVFARLMYEQSQTKSTDLGYREIDQPFVKGRYHYIGFHLPKDEASICLRCHGSIPHDRSKEIRSFLNMHAFYLACETCHARPEKGKAPWIFSWYDKTTGQHVGNPRALLDIGQRGQQGTEIKDYPMYGNYKAKITPAHDVQGKLKPLHGAKELAFFDRYMTEQKKLRPERKSQMKQVIHRHISNEPVQCKECHRDDKKSYIPFVGLGYSPARIKELSDDALVDIIRKYSQINIPNVIKSGSAEK